MRNQLELKSIAEWNPQKVERIKIMITPKQKGLPVLLFFYFTKTEYVMLRAENQNCSFEAIVYCASWLLIGKPICHNCDGMSIKKAHITEKLPAERFHRKRNIVLIKKRW